MPRKKGILTAGVLYTGESVVLDVRYAEVLKSKVDGLVEQLRLNSQTEAIRYVFMKLEEHPEKVTPHEFIVLLKATRDDERTRVALPKSTYDFVVRAAKEWDMAYGKLLHLGLMRLEKPTAEVDSKE